MLSCTAFAFFYGSCSVFNSVTNMAPCSCRLWSNAAQQEIEITLCACEIITIVWISGAVCTETSDVRSFVLDVGSWRNRFWNRAVSGSTGRQMWMGHWSEP